MKKELKPAKKRKHGNKGRKPWFIREIEKSKATEPKFTPGQIIDTGSNSPVVVSDDTGRAWVIDARNGFCKPLRVYSDSK